MTYFSLVVHKVHTNARMFNGLETRHYRSMATSGHPGGIVARDRDHSASASRKREPNRNRELPKFRDPNRPISPEG